MALFGNLQNSLFGDSGAGDTIKRALAEIQKVQAPTPESMMVELQKLVSAGVLTPEQAQTALQEGNAFDSVSSNNSGMGAELDALSSLQNIASQGGHDAQAEADLNKIMNQVNAQEHGANQAALQSQAQRGALTGGESLVAKLLSNQNASASGKDMALQANAAAQSRVMDALKSVGSLGGAVQGQQYGAEANKANAANAIAQFNAQQSNAMNQFNTGAKNNAQQVNLTNNQDISNQNVNNANTNAVRNSNLLQQKFNNDLSKASAFMGGSQSLANQQQTAANQNQQLWGGLIGSGATALSGGAGGAAKTSAPQYGGQFGPPPSANAWQYNPNQGYAEGGVVPGQAPVPGDDPMNDTVPARLSPGEVVIPRSVVQQGDPNSVMGFLQRMRQESPKKASVEDIALVLQALGSMGGMEQTAVPEMNKGGMC